MRRRTLFRVQIRTSRSSLNVVSVDQLITVYNRSSMSDDGVNSQLCCDYYGLSLLNIHAVCKTLAWSAFRQSFLPELDRIYIIKKLLGVKFGFMTLPFFDAEQVDCLLVDLCTG